MPLGRFRVFHPSYDDGLWAKSRALYSGGSALLEDEDLMNECFPAHHGEDAEVYEERKSRAFYVPYAGEIVDKIVANVTQQKIAVSSSSLPDQVFYEEFAEDVSRPGGQRVSLTEYVKDIILHSLLTRWTWTQVALPTPMIDAFGVAIEFPTLEAEDAAGMRRAFLIHKPAETVINWREDNEGRLLWLVTCDDIDTRESFDSSETLRRTVYVVWTPESWSEHVFEWDETEFPDGPPDDLEPISETSGFHTFGAVPFVQHKLPKGLYAMGKLESIARELFNKHCALSWAEYRNLFPILGVFLQKEEVLQPISSDANRGVNQRVGPGNIWQGAEKDRMEFITPDVGPYEFTLKHISHLRDEMHRVTHQMAHSIENSAAALRRSAHSRELDLAAEAIISNAIGQLIREHTLRIYDLVASGRGETVDWKVMGMVDYEVKDTKSRVDEMVQVESVAIPSATFQKLYKKRIALRLLGPDITQEQMDAIEEELEMNFVAQMFEPGGAFNAPDQQPEDRTPEQQEAQRVTPRDDENTGSFVD